ncbi:MAG TPA: choice-of-anchor Q domain-containing protein, partial [Tepidisphaeraceae bacterium]|nr:choice-of-anchor Q domain-containing protein [Tepidisphaeraceae bacterium]
GGKQLGIFDVTNRVAITNGITLQSVNGASVTFIRGYQVPNGVSLTNAIRCVYLASNAVLSGFTLTNGSAGFGNYVNGGGAVCVRGSGKSPGGVISNCVFLGNFAAGAGGGTEGGNLFNCALVGNFGQGGGAASDANLVNCTITNNLAGWAAGTLGCSATNCLFAFNHATNYGGASGFSTLVNCTIVANSLHTGLGGNGGGSYHDVAYNSIIYGNIAPNGPNISSSVLGYCCTALPVSGTGNFTNAPVFINAVAGDFHMQSNSPCINAGRNAYATLPSDLDGNARISGATVDVGAYEFQNPASVIAYYWLQNFGLPTDGSADFADPDQDGQNTWSEWRSGTVPTNALSALKAATPSRDSSGITITWQSVSGMTYYIQRATNLAANPAFIPIHSNIVGQAGTTSYKDTGATEGGPYFYRVGVQ